MKTYKLTAMFDELFKYDPLAKEHDYIEIIEWHNGEGIDVTIYSSPDQRFSLTWGQFKHLKKMVKRLHKINDEETKERRQEGIE